MLWNPKLWSIQKTFFNHWCIVTKFSPTHTSRCLVPLFIAASQLPNRTTQFARFGLPITLTDQTVSRFSGLSAKAKAQKDTDVYIWEKHSLRSLKDMTKTLLICLVKKIILGGDFRQVLPRVKHGGRVWKLMRAFFVCPVGETLQLFFSGGEHAYE